MHLRSREEIDLIRLLSRCEQMASHKKHDWKLEQYVESLKEKLNQVQNLDVKIKPSDDVLKEYKQKITFLGQFLNASSLPETSKKSLVNQFLAPAKSKTIYSAISVPTGKEIQVKTSAKYESDMKSELFATSSSNSDGVRNRVGRTTQEDVDAALQHQQKMQEKVAEDMVALTKNLKHNVVASNQIIKEDCEVLQKSIGQTDTNFTKLQNETNRLDKHLQKGANWWLWISIALVCFVFFGMIFFIRFFPK